MYILVILAITGAAAPALTNIPGFNSQRKCEVAGDVVVKDLNRKGFTSVYYSCPSQGG